MPVKIGLTGGIGCGKSTVIAHLREAGLTTIESDAIVRQLLQSDGSIVSAIFERWGRAVAAPDGSLDRKAIARRVFSDDSDLRWLEQLLHPRVRERWESELHQSSSDQVVVEIPLLFEKNLETHFDFTVCVESAEFLVNRRMIGRGYSKEDVERRRRRQLPIQEKIERANFVLSNSGSLQFLKLQTQRLVDLLCANR